MLSTVSLYFRANPIFRNSTPQSRLGRQVLAPMTSNFNKQGHQQNYTPLQIYASTTGISPFWKEKYERDARKYWDVFYKRHQDKFFKDRHYLDKEWGSYFTSGKKVVLEVGCGAGNTIFPLLVAFPDIFVHACDFSSRAIDLVMTHKDYQDSRINAFVCDLTVDELTDKICPSSVDIVTMIFVLSAVSPEKMSLVLQNVKRVLKPKGYVLLRDYATGDLAQERLNCKDQKIGENFYVRGDGTRAFYFSEEGLSNLFEENGFQVEQLDLYCKQIENRSREIVMNRRWIQSVFQLPSTLDSSDENLECNNIDISEGIAAEMFGMLPSNDKEVVHVDVGGIEFNVEVLSKEYQHTCKSTGLMLWESARLMAFLLASGPSITRGKKVLELGSGCCGICAMTAARFADLVVATDGDAVALDLLDANIASNTKPPLCEKLLTRTLEWGRSDQVAAVKGLCPEGFDVIIGADVAYIPEAIGPLFSTARDLIVGDAGSLILCHVLRRVDEPSLLLAASEYGFEVVDRWPPAPAMDCSPWLSSICSAADLPTTALTVIRFS